MKWSLSEIVRNWHRRGGLDEVEDQSMEATQLDPDVEAHLRAADVTCDHVGTTCQVACSGNCNVHCSNPAECQVNCAGGVAATLCEPGHYACGGC